MIVTIVHRKGSYVDFDPSQLLPGEIGVVQMDDPNTQDGTGVYIAITASSVVRLATAEEISAYNSQAAALVEELRTIRTNMQSSAERANTKANEAALSAQQAEASNQQIQNIMATAEATIDSYAESAKQDAIDDINDAYNARVADLNAKIQQILEYTSNAEEIANRALNKANTLENEMSETAGTVDRLNQSVTTLRFDVDQKVAGGYVDVGGYLILTDANGDQIGDRIGPFAGGGGGGGGGDVIDAKFEATNTTGWISTSISGGSSCLVKVLWSSIEHDMSTGPGTLTITVNGITRTTLQVQQGEVTTDIAQYLSAGNNVVRLRIADVYDQGKTFNLSVQVLSFSISSSFDTSTPFTGAISFPFTPVGAVSKTIYFVLDGTVLDTQVTSVSGRQLNYTIPAQSHGGHTFRCYFEADVNGTTVRSNELYYEFIAVEPLNDNVIIVSPYSKTQVQQYDSVIIPFTVYNPLSLTAEVTLYVNNELVSTQTVDRTEQSYTVRADTPGALKFEIKSGSTTKTLNITVTELDIDVEPETENLALYLSSQGRSNQEPNPAQWVYEDIEAAFTDFNWTSDGWLSDNDGITVLRVSGDARVTIPYQAFRTDFRGTGKTIELEFATRNILNYDAVILSCMSDNRGISITAQKALLKSEQSEISTQYKEDEHVRIAFVVEKRSESRLLFIYINGIASGVVQYPVDDDFSQATPVNISIGSNDCTIDLYCIRVYDNNLNRDQVVNNWIADSQLGADMLQRYNRNNVYDEYGNIVIAKLPEDLPYFIIECAELPQYKGDKKTCSGSYTDPIHPSKSFTFTNAQIDVQGTSSQYYPRKNYKLKFKSGFVTSSGTISKYAMNNDAVPTNTFTFKADMASSEGANNVELARLYEEACPYKTPGQLTDAKVRQGIDGFPMVIFWHDTSTDTTSFIGKYNFNNDKGTSEVFGFVDGDESWEIKNNTGTRVLWKSADYSGTDWLNDFEARYPDEDPAYTDSAQLAEFARWAMSTDTEQATGDALPESVTYDGVTYTNDTAAYRLAKFKAEAQLYMELESTLFYYLFTELFLMVDSRAKNAFPSFMGSEVVGE